MGAKLPRKKPRSILTSVVYRLARIIPNNKSKFRVLLDLEWIFERMSNELASACYGGADHAVSKRMSIQFASRHINPEDSVLDLGCGYGAISWSIAKIAAQVVGVDRNRFAIESAKRKYSLENLHFVQADILNYMCTSGEKFDVLILTHVLEHIDNPREFLATHALSFKRVFIEVPDFDRTFLNYYRQDLDVAQIYTDADHVTEFDRDELNTLFSELCLHVIEMESRHGMLRVMLKSS